MADQEFTDSTGKWEPLKDYLRRRGIARHGPMQVGDPVGEYRFDNLFALERKRPGVFVRGFPKEIIGGPQLLPPGEFYGYVVDDRGEGRLTHVASEVTWYVVEVLEVAAATPPASVPPADASVAVKSAVEEPPPTRSTTSSSPASSGSGSANANDEAVIAQLVSFLDEQGRMKETAALEKAEGLFEFKQKHWRAARRRMQSENKFGRGNPG